MRQSIAAGHEDRRPPTWNTVLRSLRQAAGVTQEGWAAQLGYSRRTIQRWEQGEQAPDAVAAAELVTLCSARGLFRTFARGGLAGLSIDADSLAALLADARLASGERGEDVSRASDRTRVPDGLPEESGSLVGRAWEAEELGRLVRSTPLVTLTGAGGVGKTRLALHVAHRLRAAFADGAWLVELSDVTDPTLVPVAVAHAIGAREVPGRPVADVAGQALRSRELLLLLDNCEQVRDGVATLAAELLRSCPGVHVVATSRERLSVQGEVVWPLAPLITPLETGEATLAAIGESDAVRLFVERARRVRPRFELTSANAPDVARLCRRLDGLPLAIELAAPRIVFLAPGELEAHLATRVDLLETTDPSIPARHRTLTAALDWSWSLLTDEERGLFARSSVFVDGFTLDALDDLTDGDVLPALGRLVELSLVNARTDSSGRKTRYRLLETVRSYAVRRPDTVGVTADAERRLGAWCLAKAANAGRQIHGPQQEHWFRWIEEEHGTIRGVMQRALDRADTATAFGLIAPLWWAWGVLGRPTEAQGWTERALASGDTGATMERTAALIASGAYASFAGDATRARVRLAEAAQAARSLGDIAGELTVLGQEARLLQLSGDFEGAGRLADALLGRGEIDSWTKARVLEMRAHAALRAGHPDAARSALEQALGLGRADGDTWGIATVLAELGDLARFEGRHAQANDLYSESVLLRDRLGIPGSTPSLYQNLGFVALSSADAALARDRFLRALTDFERAGDARGMAESAIGLAGVAVLDRRWPDAARLLGWADRTLRAAGAEVWPANRRDRDRTAAAVRQALGDAGWAREHARGEGLPWADLLDTARTADRRDRAVRSKVGAERR